MTDWINEADIQNMSDYEFMRTFRDVERFNPTLAADRTQKALGTNYPPNPSPSGPAAILRAELERRNLSYPADWRAEGLI